MSAMKRLKWLGCLTGVIVLLAYLFVGPGSWRGDAPAGPVSRPPAVPPAAPPVPTAGEALLEDYGNPLTPPIEDLRKIHRVATGYYTIVKDSHRFPIGGNEDLSAALRGENANRMVFVRAGHRVFSPDGLLIDRWGSPVIVHPEAWRELELRSAGPDRIPYNADDLILSASGTTVPAAPPP